MRRFGLLSIRPLGLALSWLALAAVAHPQQQGQNLQEINIHSGIGRVLISIAVPAFQRVGPLASTDHLALSSVIKNDLKLSGLFRPPKHPQFAAETHQLDLARDKIQYAEWSRTGVDYLVRGSYDYEGEHIIVDVNTYDTTSQSRVFGLRYLDYKISEVRQLAHRISNDIIKRITGHDGVANTRLSMVRQLDPLGKTKQICIMDADGWGLHPLTPKGELTATPSWGARGTELYYMTFQDHNPDLAGIILKTGATWWISRRNGLNLSPAWSEKTQRIALTLTKDGNSELYTITREGQQPQRLTEHRAIDSSPSWSPDGSRIAFQSDRSGSRQIYIMDLQTQELQRVTFEGRYNDGPVWSPTAASPERIAFTSRINGVFQICTVNADGSDLRQLTSGSHSNEDPTWAPNGLLLAFMSDRSGSKQIHTMFYDGSNQRQLTSGAPCHSPAWSPSAP